MKVKGLKNIRKVYGFTMRDLAKRLKVSVTAVNSWENEEVDVSEYRLDELSEFFGLDKQLLLKEKHDMKDMMFIEIARAEFKINDYKLLIKEDDDAVNEIVNESTKQLQRRVGDLMFRAKEGELHYEWMKELVHKLVEVYSSLPFEEYEEFDDFFGSMLSEIKDDNNKWEKLKIIYGCLHESEDMSDWENDYGLFCNVEDLLEKQVRENVEQLYKIKLYKEGLYKPDWMEE